MAVDKFLSENPEYSLVPVKEEASYLCVFENRGELVRFLTLLKCYGASCRVYAQSEAGGYLALVRPRGAEMLLREFGSPADKRTALYLEEHFSLVTI